VYLNLGADFTGEVVHEIEADDVDVIGDTACDTTIAFTVGTGNEEYPVFIVPVRNVAYVKDLGDVTEAQTKPDVVSSEDPPASEPERVLSN
jgi:hypothetical protein